MVVCEFSLQTAGNGVLLFTNLAYRLAVLFDRMQKIASKNKQIQNPTNQLLYIHKEHLYPLSFLTPLFSVQFCFSFWNLLGYSAPTFISTSVLLYFSWRVKQKIGSGHTHTRTHAHTHNSTLSSTLLCFISFPINLVSRNISLMLASAWVHPHPQNMWYFS